MEKITEDKLSKKIKNIKIKSINNKNEQFIILFNCIFFTFLSIFFKNKKNTINLSFYVLFIIGN